MITMYPFFYCAVLMSSQAPGKRGRREAAADLEAVPTLSREAARAVSSWRRGGGAEHRTRGHGERCALHIFADHLRVGRLVAPGQPHIGRRRRLRAKLRRSENEHPRHDLNHRALHQPPQPLVPPRLLRTHRNGAVRCDCDGARPLEAGNRDIAVDALASLPYLPRSVLTLPSRSMRRILL